MVGMQKTEKTMTELQIDLNMSFEFDRITEKGAQLHPVSGPGCAFDCPSLHLVFTAPCLATSNAEAVQESAYCLLTGHDAAVMALSWEPLPGNLVEDSLQGHVRVMAGSNSEFDSGHRSAMYQPVVNGACIGFWNDLNQHVPSCRYTGLKNLGNSCYMNSVLQLLWTVPTVSERYVNNAARIFASAPASSQSDFSTQACPSNPLKCFSGGRCIAINMAWTSSAMILCGWQCIESGLLHSHVQNMRASPLCISCRS